MKTQPKATAPPAQGAGFERSQVIDVLGQVEKNLHEHMHRLEQRVSDLGQRVKLIEESREREFQIELVRRMDLSKEAGPLPSWSSVQCAGTESLGNKLRRAAREL